LPIRPHRDIRASNAEFFCSSTDARRDIQECVVAAVPSSHCLSVPWGCEQSSDWCSLPVNGSKDYWDDTSCSFPVALECNAHLSLVTVVGVDEVRADEQQDKIRGGEALIDRIIEDGAGDNSSVVPCFNERASSQG
jgi:hypothetical protein